MPRLPVPVMAAAATQLRQLQSDLAQLGGSAAAGGAGGSKSGSGGAAAGGRGGSGRVATAVAHLRQLLAEELAAANRAPPLALSPAAPDISRRSRQHLP